MSRVRAVCVHLTVGTCDNDLVIALTTCFASCLSETLSRQCKHPVKILLYLACMSAVLDAFKHDTIMPTMTKHLSNTALVSVIRKNRQTEQNLTNSEGKQRYCPRVACKSYIAFPHKSKLNANKCQQAKLSTYSEPDCSSLQQQTLLNNKCQLSFLSTRSCPLLPAVVVVCKSPLAVSASDASVSSALSSLLSLKWNT